MLTPKQEARLRVAIRKAFKVRNCGKHKLLSKKGPALHGFRQFSCERCLDIIVNVAVKPLKNLRWKSVWAST